MWSGSPSFWAVHGLIDVKLLFEVFVNRENFLLGYIWPVFDLRNYYVVDFKFHTNRGGCYGQLVHLNDCLELKYRTSP